MSSFLSDPMPVVLRATVFVTAAWLLVRSLCPLVRSPRVQRLLWLLVIVQGVLLVRFEVAVGWLPSERFADAVSTQSDSETRQLLQAPNIDSSIVYSVDSTIADSPMVLARVQRPNGPMRSLAQWSVVVWSAGMLVVLLWQAGVYVRFVHSLQTVETQPEWEQEWQAALASNSLQMAVPIRTTTNAGPLVYGFPGRHTFVIPLQQWQSLSPAQRRTIMQHEIEHLRRGDTWKSAFVRLLALPQWFNPFAWLAVRRFEDCAEFACDDATRAALPDDMSDYARALLALGSHQSNTPSLASAASGRQLVERIQRVLTPSAKESKLMKTKTFVAVAVIAAITSLNTLRVVRAAQEKANTEATESSKEAMPEREAKQQVPQAEMKVKKLQPSHIKGTRIPHESGVTVILPDHAPPIPYGALRKLPVPDPNQPNSKPVAAVAQTSPPGEFTPPVPRDDEAVIDMARVFKEHPGFIRERRELKKQIDKDEAISRAMLKRFRTEFGGDVPKEQKDEFNSYRAGAQRELMAAESAIYLKIYRGVQKEVATYCRAKAIRVVRRVKDQPFDAGALEKRDKKLSTQEIISMMNSQIVFIDTKPRDITDDIIKRIVEGDRKSQAAKKAEPEFRDEEPTPSG